MKRLKKYISVIHVDFQLYILWFLLLCLLVSGINVILLLRGIHTLQYTMPDLGFDPNAIGTILGPIVSECGIRLPFALGFGILLLIPLFLWDETSGRSHMKYTGFRLNLTVPEQMLAHMITVLWMQITFWCLEILVIYGTLAFGISRLYPQADASGILTILVNCCLGGKFLLAIFPLTLPLHLLEIVMFMLATASGCASAILHTNSTATAGSGALGCAYVFGGQWILRPETPPFTLLVVAFLTLFTAAFWIGVFRSKIRSNLYTRVKASDPKKAGNNDG